MIKTFRSIAVTGLGLCGVGLVAFGLWLVFPPLAIVGVGSFCIFVAVMIDS